MSLIPRNQNFLQLFQNNCRSSLKQAKKVRWNALSLGGTESGASSERLAGTDPRKDLPPLFLQKYRMLAKKGEGTFSEVLKAQCIRTSKYVAIKCMKNNFDSIEQVTSLREIQALQRLSPHANVIKLLEVLYDQPTGRLALVFELMDMNIYELIRGRRSYVAEDRIKGFMYQLMKAMDHMHRNGIFHRDIKPENILIAEDTLKLADFGSCRGVYSKQPYTEYISTRWYRAPECLLTDGYYNYKMDMWGVGCVFFEIISLFPLFPGNNELDQIQKIHKILGTPPAQLLEKMKRRSQHAEFKFPQQDGTGIARLIPHASPACVELLNKLLAYNPDDRLSARQALRHIYFKELREKDKLQQAFLNANRSNSLRPSPRSSPRLTAHELGLNKQRGSDFLRPSLTEKNSCVTNISSISTPQSITSMSQLPGLNGKVKEDDKDAVVYTPASHIGDVQSPGTLTSVGSTVSFYVAPDAGIVTARNPDEMGVECGLPLIRNNTNNNYNQSGLSPKVTASHAPVQRSLPPRLHSPKAQSLKGTRSHRTLPELSPKSSYKPGEPPPYKKRANNSK
ncbi:hypothetical protein R1flu_009954 [Riccia fluitans]|uniref:Protein kinase domain-containing protein n=1 Tax=Riccia fluitans TaxID=41844 RepID=A0ABD1Z6L7_9MARC